ncbi:phosphoribosylformylglycinamidine cyclo-ligase [Lipingzhangella halophila]|uniref:Phosphoribosylformylglycinamidine cyclo-ligase n=1 Tax=Lipingzhangella halophila TaxID=1783352 RepID=A0A7W7RLI2_9ACTN|nr:phosphoribosylformylglycinamidine cyclo-ligase [Lipingzhangella halophila]MBB4934190.1 phosphoribosylformylglycinamidine cyclo-ligase [Lipingzhangella halophila]
MAEGTSASGAYAAAGVDITAGEHAVELMKQHVARTRRPEVLTDSSGFSGLFKLDTSGYREPVLATSTDGVGTKVLLAQALDKHDTIGIDLVGMVVDDLVVSGAEPLFLTDYIACGSVVPERVAQIVSGIAEGCQQAGCTLIGGETAEHPGVLEPHEYDLAGAGTGLVEASAVLGPDRVRAGDAVIALASSGLHSNGYSLVRRVVDEAGLDLAAHVPELGGTLGEILLTPTRVYARDCLALARSADVDVHAFAHITGGGLAANLQRCLPADVDVAVDRGTWDPPPVFGYIAAHGGIGRTDMEATFNMGVGMAAVVAGDAEDRALSLLAECGLTAWTLGRVTHGSGEVRVHGAYAS